MDTTLFAVADSKVFRSDDNSKNWKEVNNGLISAVSLLAVSDTIIYARVERDIYYSLNGGLEWWNGGGVEYGIQCMEVGGKYLFLGIGAPFFIPNTVWRRPLSEMTTTDIKDNNRPFPSGFELYQNYPNPFNPITNIKFNLFKRSFVYLKVFDSMGREIATLVSGELIAGKHTIIWNASEMSSGVYFYRLQVGMQSETKKLILLK